MAFAASRRVALMARHILRAPGNIPGAHLGGPPFAQAASCSSPGQQRWMAATSAVGDAQYVEVRGHRFFVVKSRSENVPGEPILCMPGAMGTAETDFSAQLTGLAEQHQVVSFDPRGYGKSRPPVRDWPEDFYHRDAADACAIMKDLGFDKFSVIGWSDGANAAVILAAKFPEAVKKLVIFGGNAWVEQEDIDAYEATRDVKANWSKRMLDLHVPVYGEELQPMWDGFCDAMKGIMARGGDINKEEAISLTCPTFVLAGEKDPIVPMYHPTWYSENIRNVKMHVFPAGKHNIHIKYADEFNSLVLKFLAE